MLGCTVRRLSRNISAVKCKVAVQPGLMNRVKGTSPPGGPTTPWRGRRGNGRGNPSSYASRHATFIGARGAALVGRAEACQVGKGATSKGVPVVLPPKDQSSTE